MMLNFPIDLRSDTITEPTPAMRKAIAGAEVGDDVFSDDPTVLRLQEKTAEILGKEAAIYVPSGTMSNQIGVRLHCRPGDELICEKESHLYNYEQGGYTQLSGVSARPIEGKEGVLNVEQLRSAIRPDDEHQTRTRLVCLENTHNRAAGRILPYDEVKEICDWGHENNLRMHLDGARLFNAVVGSNISADRWACHFDTVSVCFSKGLGAPVGSALAGSEELIREARRHRKLFGGGMRQVGIIAVAALYALDNNIDRLVEDHTNAQIIADAVSSNEFLKLDPERIDTNIIFIKVDPSLGTAAQFTGALENEGVRALVLAADLVRMVTNLQVSQEAARQVADVIRRVGVDGLR